MRPETRLFNEILPRARQESSAALMSSKTVLSLVLIGIFSFAALITLYGYAGDLRDQDSGGAHALSRSAIGFGGLASLLGDLDYEVQLMRTKSADYSDAGRLRVYTLARPQQNPIKGLDTESPTLLVLSKWRTVPMEGRQDWVRKAQSRQSTFSPSLYQASLKTLTGDISVTQQSRMDSTTSYTVSSKGDRWSTASDVQIETLQSIAGDNLIPLYSADNFPVLVQVKGTLVYILSDPDFLNTMGLATNIRARLGVDMLDAVIEDAEAFEKMVAFDLSLHGYGGGVNIIKVMTQPPFLAATLCLLAAGGLIAWQAFSRFGKPIASERFQTKGKVSLVESASDFIGLAQREPKMATDYAKIIRQQVTAWLSLQGRRSQDVDAILEARENALTPPFRFADLQDRAEQVSDIASLLKVSEDLQQWKLAMTTGHNSIAQENEAEG